MEDKLDKLLESMVVLSLRVTAIEKVLHSNGVITHDQYKEAIKDCTKDAKISISSSSSGKILS